MHHIICHFEIPVNDVEKMKSFYGDLFGWKFTASAELGDYIMIDTGGQPGGGMMKKPMPEAMPVNYILVESVADYSEKITKRGGQIIVSRAPIPGMGYYAIGLDPEGNTVGLFENNPAAQ
ncbi:MAG: VOC family protein [Candidatus Eremiobacteraeota bacterium]|nr:VOC family protein [Candidatus Eremiobacteraeota bacterium]